MTPATLVIINCNYSMWGQSDPHSLHVKSVQSNVPRTGSDRWRTRHLELHSSRMINRSNIWSSPHSTFVQFRMRGNPRPPRLHVRCSQPPENRHFSSHCEVKEQPRGCYFFLALLGRLEYYTAVWPAGFANQNRRLKFDNERWRFFSETRFIAIRGAALDAQCQDDRKIPVN